MESSCRLKHRLSDALRKPTKSAFVAGLSHDGRFVHIFYQEGTPFTPGLALAAELFENVSGKLRSLADFPLDPAFYANGGGVDTSYPNSEFTVFSVLDERVDSAGDPTKATLRIRLFELSPRRTSEPPALFAERHFPSVVFGSANGGRFTSDDKFVTVAYSSRGDGKLHVVALGAAKLNVVGEVVFDVGSAVPAPPPPGFLYRVANTPVPFETCNPCYSYVLVGDVATSTDGTQSAPAYLRVLRIGCRGDLGEVARTQVPQIPVTYYARSHPRGGKLLCCARGDEIAPVAGEGGAEPAEIIVGMGLALSSDDVPRLNTEARLSLLPPDTNNFKKFVFDGSLSLVCEATFEAALITSNFHPCGFYGLACREPADFQALSFYRGNRGVGTFILVPNGINHLFSPDGRWLASAGPGTSVSANNIVLYRVGCEICDAETPATRSRGKNPAEKDRAAHNAGRGTVGRPVSRRSNRNRQTSGKLDGGEAHRIAWSANVRAKTPLKRSVGRTHRAHTQKFSSSSSSSSSSSASSSSSDSHDVSSGCDS